MQCFENLGGGEMPQMTPLVARLDLIERGGSVPMKSQL